MKKQKNIPNFGLIFLCHILMLNQACREGRNHQVNEEEQEVPTIEQVNAVQKLNPAGLKIANEDSFFNSLAGYKVLAFGHYHDKATNYTAFIKLFPKLRTGGCLVLAVEIASSFQPLLDSIMSEETPQDKTNALLGRLNQDLKMADGHKTYSSDTMTRHPLFDVILAWLNSGGIVAAIDVPYIYNESTRRNDYFTKMMLQTVKEQSMPLYEKIKATDINKLDEEKDLREISEIRAAYMAAILNYYSVKGMKTVCFLGLAHTVLSVQPIKTVGASSVQIGRKYFGLNIFSFYPHTTLNNDGFYEGYKWVGNAAYGVQQE